LEEDISDFLNILFQHLRLILVWLQQNKKAG